METEEIMEENSFMEVRSIQLLVTDMPDSILLHIFQYLPFSSICRAAIVCRRWNQVSSDELLWRSVFLWHYKLPFTTVLPKKAESWRSEFKRLFYHTPALFQEELKGHKDEVLHVSFSHDGSMFATCSKDGYFKVWSSLTSPISLKFEMDMRSRFGWHITQFSQFNETDTNLLVSGVYRRPFTTSGEIAIFDLENDFEMQSRVTNKPHDIFGAWYDNEHLLSGTIYPMGGYNSISAIWISKASQEVESEVESVSMILYRFHNCNSSSVRLINVADVESAEQEDADGASLPCSCEIPCGNSSESSLLDKLLCKEISEDEFDLEDEDSDSDDGQCNRVINTKEDGDEMSHKLCNASTSERKSWTSGEKETLYDCLKSGEQVVNMKADCENTCFYSMHASSVDMCHSRTSNSSSYKASHPSVPQSADSSNNASSILYPSHNSTSSGDVCMQSSGVEDDEDVSGASMSDLFTFYEACSSYDSRAHQCDDYADQIFEAGDRLSQKVSILKPGQLGVMLKKKPGLKYAETGDLCGEVSQNAQGEEESLVVDVPGGICTDRERIQEACFDSTACLRGDSSNSIESSGLTHNSVDMEFEFDHISIEKDSGIDGIDGAASSCAGLEKNFDCLQEDCTLPAGSSIGGNTLEADSGHSSLSPICSARDRDYHLKAGRLEQESNSAILSPSRHKSSKDRASCDKVPWAQKVSTPTTSCGSQTVASKSHQCLAPGPSSGRVVKPYLNSNQTTRPCQYWTKGHKAHADTPSSHHSHHRQKCSKRPPEKLLIYTWGTETFTPHKIGIKRMKWTDFHKGKMTVRRGSLLPRVIENLQNGGDPIKQDEPDHSIEMHGHIVGLRVSPDQSLDVSEDFVVSGAEDKQGYLWDRHYSIPLYRFPHDNVVNCVAVNPTNPEMLVTVSDDYSIKVWASRHKLHHHKKQESERTSKFFHRSDSRCI
ncbi:F-box/WD repeat-containing protein 5 [Elysia marginata]|uniref:F-box/WD repeat-containing protein 5 n=1 Tax=Elysia marginata TaxID=1093978 RepID=A0AAV4FT70_9GAST|nr:F-box/WD repeat-containing protein 5 [Elysia marginata]